MYLTFVKRVGTRRTGFGLYRVTSSEPTEFPPYYKAWAYSPEGKRMILVTPKRHRVAGIINPRLALGLRKN
jgi:hypothetical protein